MKTKIFLTLLIIATTIASVSAQSNKIVKQNRDVATFSAINASSGWDVIIRQGNRQSVAIEVSENILDRVLIEVKDGTLHISNKSQKGIRIINGIRDVTLKAYITVTDLTKITASGGVDIEFETPLNANDFTLNMSGGSDLEKLSLNCNNFSGNFSGGCDAEINFVSAHNVKTDISGGSDVKFTGKTDKFTIIANGGSDVSATELEARDCTANFSGAADGSIRVTNRLNATVSGAADLVCYGNPREVTKSVNRSSSLKIR